MLKRKGGIGILEQGDKYLLSYNLNILWKLIYPPAEIKKGLCIWEACQVRSEISGARVEKILWNTDTEICVTVIFEIYLQGTLKKNKQTQNYPMPQTQRSKLQRPGSQ